MLPLRSPWTSQLKRSRTLQTLTIDTETDICIVGGGIAGIVSAYYVLKYTNHRVVVLEAFEVGHGATGHNGGQLLAELERSIASMVNEYGLEKTITGLQSVESAWLLLEEILRDANLDLPYSTFIGHNFFTTKKQIENQLADLILAHQGGLHSRKMYISENHIDDLGLDNQYAPYYEVVPHESILSLGETVNDQYIAAYPLRKGCLNSAMLTEQLVSFLLETYGENRIRVYEHTSVSEMDLHKESVQIKVHSGNQIQSKRIILCTNGFESFTIKDRHNAIDMNFHKNVKGNIGYMFAHTENIGLNPSANVYLEKAFDNPVTNHPDADRDVAYGNEYIYATRRPYDLGKEQPKNLFCIGGRGAVIEDTTTYGREHVYQEEIRDEYLKFIEENFKPVELDEDHEEFIWHGLMGYTSNGLRLVGFEPRNKVLMYNLGCNGIGLLPSIWGGKRIASLLNGDTSQSLFDPR